MKRNQFCLGSRMLVALVWAGCQPKHDTTAQSEATVEIGPKYSAKNGLFVPEDTRQSLGLKTVEVTERKIPMRFELALRVYRVNATASLASGAATPEQARVLKAGLPVQVLASDGQKLAGKLTS